ncbi:MAG: 4-alpha-glucanotransferase [Vicinamibacterales bacterium]
MTARRRAGLLIPLFAFPRSTSWGIGDIGDIDAMAAWLSAAGQRVLQLLPLNEMARGQQSPYSAMSAMAIDPIYIDVSQIDHFAAAGGEAALSPDDRLRLSQVREAATVDYSTVRDLKDRACEIAFARFLGEWNSDTTHARGLRAYINTESWWLDDYALYRALHDHQGHRPWTEWSREWQERDVGALAEARRMLERDILFAQYRQWIADAQWHIARQRAHAHNVTLLGDLPFMVDGDSADVWAHQDQFRLDRSVGVPPDAFSATGQDWGMPAYRWDAIAAQDFGWLRQRARRSAALFDGYRVDHLVGFYRTYSRPRAGGEPTFEPAEESAQLRLGECNMAVFRESGAEIIAEDLGVVPDFVRQSLTRLQAPGFKIFRWEREWEREGQPFRDPAGYPVVSVAASGTHDTEPMRTWWEQASDQERRAIAEVCRVARLDASNAAFTPDVRDALLEMLFASRSELLLLPIQDVFGWSDRINVPGTVTPHNWSFRLPWPVDRLEEEPSARERRHALRDWTKRYDR